MNKRIAIIIDDIIQANEKGVMTQLKDWFNKKFHKRSKKSFTLKNGDAIILEFNGKDKYYSEEEYYLKRNGNRFVKSLFASSIPETDTFYLMNDYTRLYNFVKDLLDTSDNERETIRFVVEEPIRPKYRFRVKIRENVRIFERFVKIGWNTYKRRYDYATGRDYIDVDGDIFFIKSDRRGDEYLV